MPHQFDAQPQAFEGIAEMARKLGVEPYSPPLLAQPASVLLLTGTDGRGYAVHELVLALLERLDEGAELAVSIAKLASRRRKARSAKPSASAAGDGSDSVGEP